MREATLVDAVVVDHVFFLQRLDGRARAFVELRNSASAAPRNVALGLPGGGRTRGRREAGVGSYERCMAPVRLHPSSLRRPVVRVPYACVHPHLLARRKRDSHAGEVGERSDRLPVHGNSACT